MICRPRRYFASLPSCGPALKHHRSRFGSVLIEKYIRQNPLRCFPDAENLRYYPNPPEPTALSPQASQPTDRSNLRLPGHDPQPVRVPDCCSVPPRSSPAKQEGATEALPSTGSFAGPASSAVPSASVRSYSSAWPFESLRCNFVFRCKIRRYYTKSVPADQKIFK